MSGAALSAALGAFCAWLGGTPLSGAIQNVGWIIPSVQSLHILSIAVVMSSVLMVDLRLLGAIGRGLPVETYMRRFLPWIWAALAVLLATGTVLIIGEPARSLANPTFQVKMILLVLALGVTAALQRPVGAQPGFWGMTGGRRLTARALAVASLCLWTGIVFAGRWIAYTNTAGA